MIIPHSYIYNHNIEISRDEHEVINKFLAYYRNQKIIIADKYRQDFGMVPLENNSVIFKTDKNRCKCVDFCKRIFYNGKPYIIELSLWRNEHTEDELECLSIQEFIIVTKGEVHFINLDTRDITKKSILFNIISTFNEKKIISPEQAYSKQMYTNKALQGFIKNHEWQNIDTGIQQMPKLANDLFIISEDFNINSHCEVYFGTILYQLLSFKRNNIDGLNEKDLRQLDELILKLRKTQLLKVRLYETIDSSKSWPTNSILLESNNYKSRMHLSQQFTADNTELLGEQKILNKCVRALTNKRK